GEADASRRFGSGVYGSGQEIVAGARQGYEAALVIKNRNLFDLVIKKLQYLLLGHSLEDVGEVSGHKIGDTRFDVGIFEQRVPYVSVREHAHHFIVVANHAQQSLARRLEFKHGL